MSVYIITFEAINILSKKVQIDSLYKLNAEVLGIIVYLFCQEREWEKEVTVWMNLFWIK